jgi:acyl-CoA thioester hydrolase
MWMSDVHRFPIRVYYEDTDAAGIVYYANYLKFAERARTEMMRQSGSNHRELGEAFDAAFAVSRCEIDYLKPALLDDLLTVETRVLAVGAAVIRLDQQVHRGEDLLARLRLRIACVSRLGRPTRLPEPVRAALTNVRISKELV